MKKIIFSLIIVCLLVPFFSIMANDTYPNNYPNSTDNYYDQYGRITPEYEENLREIVMTLYNVTFGFIALFSLVGLLICLIILLVLIMKEIENKIKYRNLKIEIESLKKDEKEMSEKIEILSPIIRTYRRDLFISILIYPIMLLILVVFTGPVGPVATLIILYFWLRDYSLKRYFSNKRQIKAFFDQIRNLPDQYKTIKYKVGKLLINKRLLNIVIFINTLLILCILALMLINFSICC